MLLTPLQSIPGSSVKKKRRAWEKKESLFLSQKKALLSARGYLTSKASSSWETPARKLTSKDSTGSKWEL